LFFAVINSNIEKPGHAESISEHDQTFLDPGKRL